MPEMFENKNDGRKVIGFIFRSSMTINGVKYYAKDYGKRAFRIPIYAQNLNEKFGLILTEASHVC